MRKMVNIDIIRDKIENYILDNIEVDKSYRCNLKQLEKLEEYVNDIDLDYTNNRDLYDYIVNNNELLNSFLFSIIDELEYEIVYGNLYSFLIGIYCDNNNIEIFSRPNEEKYICLNNIDSDIKADKLSRTPVKEYNEKELCLEKDKGNLEARKVLIENYMYLVRYIASNYLDKKVNIDFQDIKQVGMEALINAVDSFDCNKGTKLSTYIYCVVTQEINSYISKSCRIIKIPADKYKGVLEYKTDKKRLEEKYGELSEYNISKLMSISLDDVMSFEKLASNVESLEMLFESGQLENRINSFNDTDTIEDRVIFNQLKYDIRSIIDKMNLDSNKKQILELYLEEAYDDFNLHSRMAEKLDISRQAVENRMLYIIKSIRMSIYLSDLLACLDESSLEKRQLLKKINYYLDLYILYDNIRVDGFVNKNDNLGDLRNIYVYFGLKGYNNEEVDLALTRLESDDLNKLYFFYGQDLKNSIVNENTLLSEKDEVYKNIFGKIKKLLDEQRITDEKLLVKKQ